MKPNPNALRAASEAEGALEALHSVRAEETAAARPVHNP